MKHAMLVLAGLAPLSGCGVQCGEGTHEVDGMCVLDITDPEAIQEICREDPPEVATFDVLFEGLDPDCPWNEGDNIGESQGRVTARVEQRITLELPASGVFCDLGFDFSTGGGAFQQMEYDDHFFLTFDEVVVASSHADLVDPMMGEEDLPIYDWDAIVGGEMPWGDNRTFCLGEDDGDSWCEIPPTETAGRIAIELDEPTVATLAWRVMGAAEIDLGFITTGDNDPDKDCRHEDFAFQVVTPWIPVE